MEKNNFTTKTWQQDKSVVKQSLHTNLSKENKKTKVLLTLDNIKDRP